MAKYVDEVEKLVDKMRTETGKQNNLIGQGKYAIVLDPTKQVDLPKMKDEVPFINFAPLQNALTRLMAVSSSIMMALDKLVEANISSAKATELNKLIYQAEQKFTANELPPRPWYVH